MEFKGSKKPLKLTFLPDMNNHRELAVLETENYDGEPDGVYLSCSYSTEKKIQRAYMLLFSKAPEMLEMLDSILEVIKNENNFNKSQEFGKNWNLEIQVIEQLIKDATEI